MARSDSTVMARVLARRNGEDPDELEGDELDDDDEGDDDEDDGNQLEDARAADQRREPPAAAVDEVEPPRPSRIVDGISIPGGVEYFRARKLRADGEWEKCSYGSDPAGALFVEWPIEALTVAEVRRRWGEGEYKFTWTLRTGIPGGGVQVRGNSRTLVIGPVPRAGDPVSHSSGSAPRAAAPPLPPPPAPAPPPVVDAFPVTARQCLACGAHYAHTARFCGNCGAAGSHVGAPPAISTINLAGAGVDAVALLTAFQQGQANVLSLFSAVTGTVTAQEEAKTQRYRLEVAERAREQQQFFKEIRAMDRERADAPAAAVDMRDIRDELRDEIRERLEDLEESISEKIAARAPAPAEASQMQQAIGAIGQAVQVAMPIAQAFMDRNGGGASANAGNADGSKLTTSS
jgi:hypothetical protein